MHACVLVLSLKCNDSSGNVYMDEEISELCYKVASSCFVTASAEQSVITVICGLFEKQN